MLRAAVRKAICAGTAPEPRVALTHAPPNSDQVTRSALDAVRGRELRDQETLHAEERNRRERDLRQLDDLELEPARLERVGLPRARDPEGGLPLEEGVLRGAVVDLRVDQAFLVPLVDQRSVLEELPVRHADVRRVEVAGFFCNEPATTETREE